MKIVVDTNVWVSALVFGGNPAEVLEKVLEQDWKIIVSEELLMEMKRIINDKFPAFLTKLDNLLVELQPLIQNVKLGVTDIKEIRDPKDKMILETAVAGSADIIISGDDDLLSLKSYRKMKIVNPAEFLTSA